MTGRRALVPLTGAFVLTLGLSLGLTGCSEAPPPPASGNLEENWPDEVKQAEAAFREKGEQNAAKAARGRR